MDSKNKTIDDGASKSSSRIKSKRQNIVPGKRKGSLTGSIDSRKSSNTSPRKVSSEKSATRKKPKKRGSSNKIKKIKDGTVKEPELNNPGEYVLQGQKGTDVGKSDKLDQYLIGATSIDFEDVGLRWDDICEDPVDELRRIEAYKANRRLRYIQANNLKIAALTLQDRKF